jgi:hypothetical protein
MRFENANDGYPEWIYGDGYLWLYDVGTEGIFPSAPRLPAEVLRISLTTGAVLATIRTPVLTRVLLGVDQDGLWIGVGRESFGAQHGRVLYFLGSRATHLEPVGESDAFVNWLAASGHSTWAGVAADHTSGGGFIETFNGIPGKPRLVRIATGSAVPSDTGEGPPDTSPVLDAPGVGLVGLLPGWGPSVADQQIVKIDPTTGVTTSLTSVHFGSSTTVVADAVFGDDLYILIGNNGRAVATLWQVRI